MCFCFSMVVQFGNCLMFGNLRFDLRELLGTVYLTINLLLVVSCC